jgi:hypothetical protein
MKENVGKSPGAPEMVFSLLAGKPEKISPPLPVPDLFHGIFSHSKYIGKSFKIITGVRICQRPQTLGIYLNFILEGGKNENQRAERF